MFSIFIASFVASRSPARIAWPGCTATSTSSPGNRRQQVPGQIRRRLERHQRVELGRTRRSTRTSTCAPWCVMRYASIRRSICAL
jgi:hypothetical protein